MEIIAESQSFPAQHSWPAAAAPNHDGLPILGCITNQDLANASHYYLQVISSLRNSVPELASSDGRPHVVVLLTNT